MLGATYFANTYQFTNSLPNLVFYGLLAGSMFSSLLVPALVGHIDSGDRPAAARTAGGLLGMAMLGMLAIVPVAAVATPWLLRLGSAGAADSAAASSQAHVGAVLVLLLLPQVPLYAIVGTATAVMNAHRRFALAGRRSRPGESGHDRRPRGGGRPLRPGRRQQSVPLSLMLLLGLGTTGAVMLHASVQWWGARRVGIALVPKAGWRDPQVRATIRRALPALAQAALAALQLGALSLAADRVPGGVVAFQLAANFYFLPIALAATPVALSLVPRLSRMTAPGQAAMFRDTYVRGLAFACFLAVPAATAYARPRPAAGRRDRVRRLRRGGRPRPDRGGAARPGTGDRRRDAVPGHHVRLLRAQGHRLSAARDDHPGDRVRGRDSRRREPPAWHCPPHWPWPGLFRRQRGRGVATWCATCGRNCRAAGEHGLLARSCKPLVCSAIMVRAGLGGARTSSPAT